MFKNYIFISIYLKIIVYCEIKIYTVRALREEGDKWKFFLNGIFTVEFYIVYEMLYYLKVQFDELRMYILISNNL